MSLNLRNVFGIVLIAIGLVAVPIPIVPGLPLIVAGAALLGHHHPLIRSCRTWLQRRGFLKEGNSEG
ncbi:MAG TPA: PGPGW domain-containing protein [Candidatus Sulfotelmatobacter sp.]|nr:PGPGW domain-containing protein [Candidatus Sulfotelmatobacter sp.]